MRKFSKDILRIINTEGIFSFLKKTFFFLSGQLILFCLAPFFWVMKIRFLPVNYAAIGHLAGELDCYIKEGVLGLRSPYKPVMLIPGKDVANTHLLNYWKKYIRIIDNTALFSLLWPALRRNRLISYNVEKYFFGRFTGSSFPQIQKKYYGRPPVLSLFDSDRERGWAELRKIGVPEGAWFVCVHCRENGYGYQKNKYLMRDNNVANYLPAMREIVDRGGWVIRVGDATMTSIAKAKNIIDYAHMDIKSEWMDVFLAASCRFFLGSGSGLVVMANVFGVRSVTTNTAGPFSVVLPYGPEDIGIPKLIWSEKEERYLSFREILASSIGNFYEDHSFAANSVRAVENSPEDIKEVAIEMLERMEGRLKYSQDDERLQARFKSQMNPTHFSYGAISRVGRDFLRKYEYLL